MSVARMWRDRRWLAGLVTVFMVLSGVGVAAASSQGPRARRAVGGSALGRPGFSPTRAELRASALRTRHAVPSQAPVTAGAEVPWLRRRDSNTFLGGSGRLVTKIYPFAINYKTASGALAPINSALVRSPSGYAQQANNLGVLLPASGSDAGHVSVAGGSLAFGLEGASGVGSVSGREERFASPPSAVGLTYTSLTTGVAWNATLPAGSGSQAVKWLIDPLSGLSARLVPQGVAFDNSAHKLVWLFRAPLVTLPGVHRPVATRMSLQKTAQGTVIAITLAHSSAPKRTAKQGTHKFADYHPGSGSAVFAGLANPYPIVMSGEIAAGMDTPVTEQTGDCYVDSGSPDTSFCVENTNYVGPNDNTLINYDVADSLPQHVQILQAFVNMYQTSDSNNTDDNVEVYESSKPWNNFATWNTYDGTNKWQNGGGDTTGSAEGSQQTGDDSWNGYWDYWDVYSSMQGWVDGNPSQVDGLEFEDTSGTNTIGYATETDPNGNVPYISVIYEPRMGNYPGVRYDSQQLTDRSSLGVNVANGNLFVSNNDVQLPGINGLNLDLSRYYNNNSTDQNSFGVGWSMGTGADTYLEVPNDTENTVDYFDGSGNAQVFHDDASGNPVAPPGEDAQLSMNVAGDTWNSSSFSILFRHSGITQTFTKPVGRPYIAQLTSMTDRNDNKITYNYNSSDQLTSLVDTHGNASGGDPSNHTTTIQWSSAGYVSQITDPSGRNWYYEQNSNGQLTSYKDPAGNTTYYTYDPYGNLTRIQTPQGNVVNVAYDAGNTNTVTSVTRLVHPTDSTGPTTSFQYGAPSGSCPTNPGATQTSVSDPNTHTNVFCTDDRSRITSTIDGNGHTRNTSYSADGYIASATNALNTTTTFNYEPDSNDNVKSIEQGGVTTQFGGYPSSGDNQYLPTNSTDPQGNQTDYTYDSSTGNLLSTKDDKTGTETSETHNPDGTVATSTDGDGNKTTYGYTSGNLTSITPPSGSGLNAITLTYDSANRVATISSVANGQGHEVDYTYDPLDRVTQALYKDASGNTVATINYTYDADGNRLTRTDPHGTMTYTYDGLDRLTSQVQGSPNDATTTYAYDAANNLTSLTDSGGTVSYGYDHANQLTTITDPGASTHTALTYDNDGNLTKVTYPSGASVTRGYDGNDRLVSVTDTYKTSTGSPAKFSYAYNYSNPSSGAMTDLRQTLTDGVGNKTTYSYDSLNRLTEASTTGGPNSSDYKYSYDGAGNILSANLNGTTTNYTYNTANEIATANGNSYSYDADGNETSNGNGLTMTYNALNQMTSITSSGTTTNYDYYGEGNNEIESEGSNDLHSDLLGLANHQDGSNTDYFTRATSGQQIDERLPSGTYNYLYDGNGSVIGLTDSQGHLANQYTYDPYGNQTTHTGSTTNYFNFQSGYQTAGGLYHYGARYEAPADQRWTQQDPMQQITSLTQSDRYSFTGDNPVNQSDPTGRCVILSCSTWGDIAGGFVIGAGVATGAVCLWATEGLESYDCYRVGALGVATGGTIIGASNSK